ncbi:hypothetical protein [Kyrpidia spormannii]|uniref:hypothetical protein n=1 Tax=Kyrpidia spormannii TaxID=2055160 RepID=UPI0010569422|nr:hypothetical protein [Kyrpidia spormannii]
MLDRWELFIQILYESSFFQNLTMPKGENRMTACETLADNIKKKKIKLTDLHTHESFQMVWELLGQERIQKIFYRTEASRARFREAWEEADPQLFYHEYWKPVAELFRGYCPVKWCKITMCVKSVTGLPLSPPGSVSPVVAPSRDAALDLSVTLDLAPSGRVSAARGQSQGLRVAYTPPLQA